MLLPCPGNNNGRDWHSSKRWFLCCTSYPTLGMNLARIRRTRYKSTRKHYIKSLANRLFTFNCDLSIHRVKSYEGQLPLTLHTLTFRWAKEIISSNRRLHISPMLEHLWGRERRDQTSTSTHLPLCLLRPSRSFSLTLLHRSYQVLFESRIRALLCVVCRYPSTHH